MNHLTTSLLRPEDQANNHGGNTMTGQVSAEPGWYPSPGQPGYVRYWDGYAWGLDAVLPNVDSAAVSVGQLRYVAGIAALILCAVGGALQFQSVSLLSGDGIYYIGGALAAVGAAISLLAWRKWIRVVAVIVVVLCVVNIVATEKQLNDRRQEIQTIVGS